MANVRSSALSKDLETLFGSGSLEHHGDRELLERFASERDPIAFEALVERHGPMVLRVCKSALANAHDAEDAFQATFLVLARKAGSIRSRNSVANWLFGVASRVAARARVAAARRRKHESGGLARRADDVESDRAPDFDLGDILRDELRRLPDKYGAPVVLCYLEGRTCEEAAKDLKWPVGTVKVRLSRARDILKRRLGRRGLALPAGLLAAGTSSQAATAALPPSLVASTVHAASVFAAGSLAAGSLLSSPATSLAEGTLMSMTLIRLSTFAAIVLLGASGTVAGARYLQKAPQPAIEAVAGAQKAAEAPPQSIKTTALYEETVEKGVAAAEALEDPADKAMRLSRIADALHQRGDRKRGLDTFDLAIKAAKAIPTDQLTLTPHPILTIAYRLGMLGEHTLAQRTYQDSIAIIEALRPELQQATQWPNLVAYQVQTEGRKASGETFKAYRRFLEGVQRQSPNTFDARLSGLEAHEHGAAKALEKSLSANYFKSFNIKHNRQVKQAAIDAVVEALQPDDGDEAEEVLTKILQLANESKKKDPVWAFQIPPIVNAQARIGHIHNAIETAGILESATQATPAPAEVDDLRSQLAFCYGNILHAQLKAGDKDGARASARKFIGIIKAIQIPQTRSRPLLLTCNSLTELDDVDGLKSALDALTNSNTPDFATIELIWLSIADIQKRAGDTQAATESLRNALANAEEQRQYTRTLAPQVDEANDLGTSAYLATDVAGLQARLGDLTGALRTVDSLASNDSRETVLVNVIGLLANLGDIKNASRLFDRIQSPKKKQAACIEMAIQVPINATLDGKATEGGPSTPK